MIVKGVEEDKLAPSLTVVVVVSAPKEAVVIIAVVVVVVVVMVVKTRLTYNCAHLRSTKESLTIEYLRRKLYWIFWVNIFRVKTFLVKILFG